jgi:hypothetical protein
MIRYPPLNSPAEALLPALYAAKVEQPDPPPREREGDWHQTTGPSGASLPIARPSGQCAVVVAEHRHVFHAIDLHV